MRTALVVAWSLMHVACVVTGARGAERPPLRPNIVLILADDLGYGDLGCYGQAKIRTPHLDRLAADGLRFTQFYAGSTVCAPSRCALLTGKHCGHARIRGNAAQPLMPEDITLAEVLRQAGYATGGFGKWGLGEEGSTGIPNRQGFDEWFGYLNQVHAHNYYPEFLYVNESRLPLANVAPGGVATRRVQYAPDLITERALDFIERRKDQPFFLYLAYTQPHANNEARDHGLETPSDEPYSHENWPPNERNFAAMVTGLDRDIGRVLRRLGELGLDERSLVIFTSDNGPHAEGGHDPTFFQSSGKLRGIKRSLHDGGIRVPAIARWPGRISPGVTSDVAAHWDWLPTVAELSGGAAPAETDGISLLPTLLGAGAAGRAATPHEYLYWEFHEGGFAQAIRRGDWKGVREDPDQPLELYDLAHDEGEQHNVAAEHSDVVRTLEGLLDSSRTDASEWRPRRKP